jgi:hypothetical protein
VLIEKAGARIPHRMQYQSVVISAIFNRRGLVGP